MIMHNIIYQTRFSSASTALLILFFSFQAYAFWTPKFPAPPDTVVNKLGEDMIVNGIPMHIRQFTSKNSVESILDFYRNYWPKGTEEKPGYTETDILTPWKIMTRVENGYLMTVQVTEDGDNGSRGMLSMSELPDRDERLPEPGKNFPKMRGSTVINDVQSKDIGKSGRTIQLSNTYSVQTNANFYRNYYMNHGWNIDLDKAISEGNSHSQRFSSGEKNVVVIINKTKNGAVVVAQEEILE